MNDQSREDRAAALQQLVRSRIGAISAHPLLSNGGRILTILDPDAYGWDNVKLDVDHYGMVGLTMVDRDTILERLKRDFGDNVDFPYWEAFTGTPQEVIPACRAILAGTTLPDGWQFSHHTCPDDATIATSASLNLATGVSPYPAYYLRSEHVPSLLSCLWAPDGKLAGCASAQMRYHPEGPLGGWLFAGGVSIDPAQRRRGLGSLVNAALLVECQARFGWLHVLEQAKADNAPSVGMIRRCGLTNDLRKVTFLLSLTGGHFTR